MLGRLHYLVAAAKGGGHAARACPIAPSMHHPTLSHALTTPFLSKNKPRVACTGLLGKNAYGHSKECLGAVRAAA